MSVYVPPKVRGPLYVIFGLVGLGIGSTQVGFASANMTQPTWLNVALSVYAFVGSGIGYTAASHTPARPKDDIVLDELDSDYTGRH